MVNLFGQTQRGGIAKEVICGISPLTSCDWGGGGWWRGYGFKFLSGLAGIWIVFGLQFKVNIHSYCLGMNFYMVERDHWLILFSLDFV